MIEHETSDFQPRYEFTRVFYTSMIFLGAVSILFTLLWVFPSADDLSDRYYGFDLVKLAKLLWGTLVGVGIIAMGQIGQATVDNANANLEMLFLMKRGMRKREDWV